MPSPAISSNPGMDPELFEQFIDQLDRYVRERLIPAEREVIASDRIPAAILEEMREMGLFGLTVPEEHGGSGMNLSQYARTIRAIGYAMPAYRSIISINIGMFNSALKNGGTDEQKAQWLPRLAAGEIACFGLTEPGSGSDSAAMQTTATRDVPASRMFLLRINSSSVLGLVSLACGNDSPVTVALFTRTPKASIRRQSAGTSSPSSSRITSPGTTSGAGISSTLPSRNAFT